MLKKALAVILYILCLAVLSSCGEKEEENLFDRAKDSVVRVTACFTVTDEEYPDLAGMRGYMFGSGFIPCTNTENDQYVITAGHVVARCSGLPDEDAEAVKIKVDGQYVWLKVHVDEIRVEAKGVSGFVTAELMEYSRRADAAVLKLSGKLPRKGAMMYDCKGKDFDDNEQLIAMGFPAESETILLSDAVALSLEGDAVMNEGSYICWESHAETGQGDRIAVSAEIRAGMSGGPLVDRDGYVVGICVYDSECGENGCSTVASDECLLLVHGLIY